MFLATSDLVTERQVRRLFALVKVEGSLETAAAKAGMDAKTVRKYRRLERVPSELTPGPRWRTREDPGTQAQRLSLTSF